MIPKKPEPPMGKLIKEGKLPAIILSIVAVVSAWKLSEKLTGKRIFIIAFLTLIVLNLWGIQFLNE